MKCLKEAVVFLARGRVAFVMEYPKNFRVIKYPIESKGRVRCDGPDCRKRAVSQFHASKKGSSHEIVVYVCDKPEHQSEGEQIALREAMKQKEYYQDQ